MLTIQKKINLSEINEEVGTGWLIPYPDLRDYTEAVGEIPKMTKELGISSKGNVSIPSKVDLTEFCSTIENQENLGACTAHAAVGIVEYFQIRSYGRENQIEGSRLFIYKTTRNLMGVTGDTGAWLRNTMGALVLCGVPPEKYLPYKVADFDKEPSAFIYSIADNYEALKYFSHDPQGQNIPKNKVLERVKSYIAAGIPSMFGFFGFDSFDKSDTKGGIPYPCPNEKAKWGHAIVAVGYDDNKMITNTQCNKKTKGALLIRNSWGITWGEKGYGWLPYDYVLSGFALDFWSLISMEWINTKQFGLM